MAFPLLPVALGAFALFMLTRKGSADTSDAGAPGGAPGSTPGTSAPQEDPCVGVDEMPMPPSGRTDGGALPTSPINVQAVYNEFMNLTADNPAWKGNKAQIIAKAKRLSLQLRCNGYYAAQKGLDAKIEQMTGWPN